MLNERGSDTLWITSYTGALLDIGGNFSVGTKYSTAFFFNDITMEPAQTTKKSVKRVDLNLYEGVGRILDLSKENGPTLLFDCGIHAYCQYASLPAGIESGSFVRMRFNLYFDRGFYHGYLMNGDFLVNVVPEILYHLKVKEILVLVEYDSYFKDLPVAYESNNGAVYKSIKKTDSLEDCGGEASYILVCEQID